MEIISYAIEWLIGVSFGPTMGGKGLVGKNYSSK